MFSGFPQGVNLCSWMSIRSPLFFVDVQHEPIMFTDVHQASIISSRISTWSLWFSWISIRSHLFRGFPSGVYFFADFCQESIIFCGFPSGVQEGVGVGRGARVILAHTSYFHSTRKVSSEWKSFFRIEELLQNRIVSTMENFLHNRGQTS